MHRSRHASAIPLVVLVAAFVTGCGTFSAGLEEPDLGAQAAGTAAAIRVGQTTRAQVRALLGEPLFADEAWGIELYEKSQTDYSTEWLFVLVPVPGWVQAREYRLYPLIVYDPGGLVAALGIGQYAERHREDEALKVPWSESGEALGFTLELEACPEPACLRLLAPREAGISVLRSLPEPGSCALDIAIPASGIQIELDGRRTLVGPRWHYDYDKSAVPEPWFTRQVLRPGSHELRAKRSSWGAPPGEINRTITCRGGEIFVVRAETGVQPAKSFLGHATREGEFKVVDSPAAIPDDARLILFHDGRSLAAGP
jgi:hypothetical protein